MPAHRLALFNAEVVRARDLVGLGQSVAGVTYGVVDASDLYRASVVHSVAALDSYFHGVVMDRAVDILLGRIAGGTPDRRVGLHFGAVQQLLAAATPVDLELTARSHVAERLSIETLQRADAIGKALSSVGVTKIWASAFTDPQAATTALGVVVSRRNQIVHACDSDPLNPGAVLPLSDADALAAITTIETTVHHIDPHC